MIPVRAAIPSLFTVMNLFSGFIAVKTAMMDHDFVGAGWFILLGAIFDMLDGVMARLTKSASEFGVELDSLADVVTFGVGPSAIVYSLFFWQYEGVGLLVAALPAICGALRLARFNVQLVGFDKDYFKGLPIPSAALLVISFITFIYLPHAGGGEAIMARAGQAPVSGGGFYDTLLWIVVISAGLLMVSTIKYDAIPKFSKKAILEHPMKFGLFASGILLVIVTKGSAIFPLFVLFILSGVLRSTFNRISHVLTERRALALLDEESEQEEEINL